MGRMLRVGELLLAVEGLALARTVFSGDDEATDRRIGEIEAIVDALRERRDPEAIERLAVRVSEQDPRSGYADWAESYDGPENPLIAVEQPIVHEIVRTLPPGDALDACCGTGRHAALLQRLGHRVTGIDQSPEMLALARSKVPDATFVEGDLLGPGAGPLPDAAFDLTTCALALTHFDDLVAPIAALARVTRPGGTVVLSDIHPFATLLDGQAVFSADDGDTRFVRNVVHPISSYLEAFRAAGLTVRRCIEKTIGEDEGPLAQLAGILRPEAARAAYLGLPFLLVWELERPLSASDRS